LYRQDFCTLRHYDNGFVSYSELIFINCYHTLSLKTTGPICRWTIHEKPTFSFEPKSLYNQPSTWPVMIDRTLKNYLLRQQHLIIFTVTYTTNSSHINTSIISAIAVISCIAL
jgi:hypothetical protein